jgi:hypothetical protein
MKSRPGFVLEVDKSTPPILVWHGEGFKVQKMPVDSRIIYPKEPISALEDPDTAVRQALENPLGDTKPLSELLFPSMKLTIAFDDISLPLPPMEAPDNRQRVIEAVLNLAAEKHVEDVVLIAALALHRRMTDAELKHCLGERIYNSFAPNGLLLQHDAEDPDNLTYLGKTEKGEDVEINKRAAESDLIVYVNINLVAMDGGHKSVATGLSSYRSIRHHHNVATMQHSRSFMDQSNSELHSSNWRIGRFLANEGVKVFQIETTLNTDTFPKQFSFLQKREWEWTFKDRLSFSSVSKALELTPGNLKTSIFNSIKAPHRLTSVQAGEVEAVHRVTTENVYHQQIVQVDGQSDILSLGLPYISPYNVNSIMNPILVACLGLGYFFNLYKGKPIVKKGGVVIMSHPTPLAFHPVHHPSYIDFFDQVLSETTDPMEIQTNYEEKFATDPWYRHLYRTSNAYHGVHPFYMWYWCAHALDYLGRVIIVGGNHQAVKRLGFASATTFNDALEIAQDVVGSSPSITHFHVPPIAIAEVS